MKHLQILFLYRCGLFSFGIIEVRISCENVADNPRNMNGVEIATFTFANPTNLAVMEAIVGQSVETNPQLTQK